jgi:hypothetical protein
MTSVRTTFLLSAAMVLLIARPSYAYLDPGSGSLLVQTIIAGVLGGLYAVKHFWARIKRAVSSVMPRRSS